MAQKVNIVLTDDLDETGNTPADETVTFSIDGTTYEIDLTSENADTLRGHFQNYIAHGRKVSGGRGKSTGKRSSGGSSNAAEIRAWAQSNGIEVPERGRIPANVREQYEAR